MSYPPEPWRLRGRMSVSLWHLPERELPATPEETVPVVVGGRGLIGAAWVSYGPGSVLEYNELLVAVLARRGGHPRVCISQIWVDSEASRLGGRELWSIPKERATFEMDGWPYRARALGIASAHHADRMALPLSWPLRWKLAQQGPEGLRESRVRATSRIVLRSGAWHVDPSGPLGWLRGRKPMLSADLDDFDMRFGEIPPAA
ncbi:acetoacetate decarboxylase family protein [Parasphingorhabdus pacifica]